MNRQTVLAVAAAVTAAAGLSTMASGCAPSTSTTCPATATAKTPSSSRREPPGAVHHAVVVTIDGLLPEAYLRPDAHGLRIPVLRRFAEEGAKSDGALSVFPSVTYPSHTSMATGVLPARHGITSNRSFDPLETDLEGWRWYAEDIHRDPVWKIAARAGYDVALVHWPVTVGAQVRWLVPEYWRAKNEHDGKVLRAVATPGLLDDVARDVPNFWPRFLPPHVHDDALADIAIHVLEQGRPHLLMVHFVGVDGAQHAHGVWSAEAVAAIEDVDHQLGRVLAAIERLGMRKDTNVLVASDHGFMDAGTMVRPGVLLRKAGLVKVDASGRVVAWDATVVVNSGQAYVYVRPEAGEAVRAKVREIFEAKAQEPGSGIGKLYSTNEIRELGGDPEAFLALEAAPGFQLGSGAVGDDVAPPAYRATHGYDPRRPEMRASLLVRGPTIPRGSIAAARLVDVGPTIASWLGLAMPDVDGKPLAIVPEDGGLRADAALEPRRGVVAVEDPDRAVAVDGHR